jgi:hypothetical protein
LCSRLSTSRYICRAIGLRPNSPLLDASNLGTLRQAGMDAFNACFGYLHAARRTADCHCQGWLEHTFSRRTPKCQKNQAPGSDVPGHPLPGHGHRPEGQLQIFLSQKARLSIHGCHSRSSRTALSRRVQSCQESLFVTYSTPTNSGCWRECVELTPDRIKNENAQTLIWFGWLEV